MSSSRHIKYTPVSSPPPSLSSSLPNLISSLNDIEKGRSGLPSASNKKGLRQDEDTSLLAKTVSVYSPTPSVASDDSQGHKNMNLSKSMNIMSPPTRDSSSPDDINKKNSYQLFRQEAESEISKSLLSATINVGDKAIKGELFFPRENTLADLDLPPHVRNFKEEYNRVEGNRLKLPLLSQISPRTRKRIALLPKTTDMEEEKIAEYSRIGVTKAKRKDTAESPILNFNEINKPVTKTKMQTGPIFKQLEKVILKEKDRQYRMNNNALIGKHPAPVMLSDQVKSLSKLPSKNTDDTSQYDHLSSEATQVSEMNVI